MIHFLRKIRRHLLEGKQVKKYAIYALGKIFLVVVGILIALQINNWNEDHKAAKKEQQILKQLKSEYESNLAQLNEKILMRSEALVACNELLFQMDHPDSLDEAKFYPALVQIVRDPTFDPIVNDIVGTANLRLIKNDTLVRTLSNWSSEVYQVQEIEIDYKKFRTESIVPTLNRLGLLRNLNHSIWKDGYTPTEALDKTFNYQFSIGESKHPVDWVRVLQDQALEGIVGQVITIHQITNIQSETLRERIEEMLKILEREID
jgi:hypothetical protein